MPSTRRPTRPAAEQLADEELLDEIVDRRVETPGGPGEVDPEADELLAEMADAEIDRLMSEHPSPAVEAPLDPREEAALSMDEDEPAARSALSGDAASAAHQPETVTSMPTDAELDALLRGDVGDGSEPDLSADLAALAAELDEQEPAAAADPDSIAADLALEARAAPPPAQPETALRSGAAGRMRSGRPVPAPARAGTEKPADRSAPWLLPLIWLNLPLRRASQPARDAIGKVALVTALNAIAVLVYVVAFR